MAGQQQTDSPFLIIYLVVSPNSTFSFFMQWKNAGIRNASAKIHARGLAKQAGRNPNTGTRQNPTRDLAAISQTPARIAKVEKPIHWMVKRTTLTKVNGM